MTIKCPNCGCEFELPEECYSDGQKFRCEACSAKLVWYNGLLFKMKKDAAQSHGNQNEDSHAHVKSPLPKRIVTKDERMNVEQEKAFESPTTCPLSLRIVSCFLLVIGVFALVEGCDFRFTPDGRINYCSFGETIVAFMMIVTAYFIRIGHNVASKLLIAIPVTFLFVETVIPDLCDEWRREKHFITIFIFGVLPLMLSAGVLFLKSARKWLVRYEGVDIKRDIKVFCSLKIWVKLAWILVFLFVAYGLYKKDSTCGWGHSEYRFASDNGYHIFIYNMATYTKRKIGIRISYRDSHVAIYEGEDVISAVISNDLGACEILDWFKLSSEKGWEECKVILRRKVKERTARQVMNYLDKVKRQGQN